MEPLGLGVGLVGLAGLFSQVLECFEYVHVARHMGKTYTYYSLRLDNSRLRLTRWSSSVDLQHVPKRENDQVEAILNSIIAYFDEAKVLSEEFKAANKDPEAQRTKADGGDERFTPEDGERNTSVLLQEMRRISLKRNPSNSKRKKTKWAIYSENHMKELVERVSSLTTELIDLFPAAKGAQEKLCAVEIWDLTQGLRALREAVEGQDDILTSALGMMLDPVVSVGYYVVHFKK